ncbi:28S ribosomal protein S15, mitochondrial-like [Anopheles merus]|uniref:Small ribosomal subunit protein uS15m n=1 Tax=Anopheles merus TaxID=30066 RepID=A0A182VHF5_ANOME|nr:28S ribosomal protein S15, mitochondrial-like [Anopheles merus]XP_041770612.1 28S ribosomal protein S15, mitochondrial-like [Anopheles merus]
MNALAKLKTLTPSVNQIVRTYALKSDLKIKWVRPEKIPCYKPEKSGDLQSLPTFAGTELMKDYRDSKELESANEHVRNLFTIQHNRRREMVENFKEDMVRRVYRHELDYGSIEAQLGLMTARIRSLQDYMEKFPRQSVVKVQLKELIDKRKRFLRYLRRWDYRRFEYMLEKLDLVYKPYPTHFHWITRKDSLRKLTNIHCDQIKETRLEEYRRQLESQQLDFLENKLKTLEFIRKEQTECQVPVTVTSDEIKAVRKQYEELKQKRAAAAESLKEPEDS